MKEIFEQLVNTVLQEAPIVTPEAPPKPEAPPAPTTTPPSPSTPNPDPFRRHDPGTMPDIRPKSKSSKILKQEILDIIRKHTRFLKGT